MRKFFALALLVTPPVIDKLEVRASSADWDGACNGDFTQTARTMSITGKRRNGLASLR